MVAVFGGLGAGCAGSASSLVRSVWKGPVTVEQHDSMAKSFEARAVDARSLAAYHLMLASKYRSAEAEWGAESQEMAAHCEALAKDYETIAGRYEALAAEHVKHSDAPNRIQHFQDGDDRSVRDGP